jgi:TonB family protein
MVGVNVEASAPSPHLAVRPAPVRPAPPTVIAAAPKPIETPETPLAPQTPAPPPTPAVAAIPAAGGVSAASAAQADAGGQSGRPGSPQAPADPAPMSDRESDPFAKVGSAEFRGGKLVAQKGRPAKLVRPRFTFKGQVDLASMANPTVVVKIKTDTTGNVTDVNVVRSSGSNEVDLPAQLAMWQSWFQPPKDRTGHAMADEFLFTLGWH